MISRTATRQKVSPPRQRRSNPDRRKLSAIDHAVRVVHSVCCLAGAASLIDDIRADLRAEGVPGAIRRHDTAPLFDWLMSALSYQGISDQVASDYMERHGRAQWADIDAKVAAGPTCPKLQSYWHFHGCRYDKLSRTCAEPDHIDACPLPTHDLRNGRLNQMAYSLFLFIRDVADGDLVGWIDRQLQGADDPASPNRLAQLREAVIGPLREVYGVSDKVLTMTLSCILLAAPRGRETWVEVGASMIAIDTLVHNFLVRTGILAPVPTPNTPTARPATGQAAAPISLPARPSRSTPVRLIRASRPSFPGSSSTRSGGTAPSLASTSATATGSMTASLARTSTANFIVIVIV